ncbi:MAG: UDP-3-O-acyl-N-acetylglucosamine deacetylase [Vulcanimicrobiaceae bacterium]
MMQHTLAETLAFEGVGLHTGAPAAIRIVPAPVDAGLCVRLGEEPPFAALAEAVTDTRRATVLAAGGRSVSTVEHVLSALAGMEIDNATIEVAGPEIPILDGSAARFCDEIARVGRAPQALGRPRFTVDRTLVFREGEALLVVLPAERFRVRIAVEFPPPVGAQFFDASPEPELYRREIAPARTFGYLHEVEALWAAGLARGGSLDNALVFAPDGPLVPLRWPDEVVRHKALDLIGDFALLGAYPQLEVVSIKSGHRLHARATAALRAEFAPRSAALEG